MVYLDRLNKLIFEYIAEEKNLVHSILKLVTPLVNTIQQQSLFTLPSRRNFELEPKKNRN